MSVMLNKITVKKPVKEESVHQKERPVYVVWRHLARKILNLLTTSKIPRPLKFCTVETFITGIVDEWPSLLRPRREVFTVVIVIILYMLGLPMVTKGGMYIFQLMDYYSASGMTLLFTVFFQTIAITWVYGVKRLSSNIEEMTGYRPNWYFLATWVFVSPAICLGIFLFSVLRYKPLVYAETYVYPWWGEVLGWGIALASMLWIPLYAFHFMLVTPGSLKDRLIAGITPTLRPSKK
ncbi:sodium- and chloride-dependent GABA transporter 1-like isoform X4 [Tachypleus tridentatus]